MTVVARKSMVVLGMARSDVVAVIAGLRASDFHKSMTTHASSQVWQDVYHPAWDGLTLYLNFSVDEAGELIVSLKEK